MNHKDYTIDELVKNPSFRRMVKGTATPEEITRWNNWIEENDQNRQKGNTAASEIVGFDFKSPEIPDLGQEWGRLYAKTAGQKKILAHKKKKNERRLKWIFRVAAILLLAGMAGFGVYNFNESDESITRLAQMTEERTVTTSDGEQKTLTFSNNSKVVLNSNSTLTYRLGLLHNQTIEVTLEGEAWFDVDDKTAEENPAFAVHTPDGIIRDIGTKFMVTVQQGQSRVVLQEGIVEIEQNLGNSDEPGDEKKIFRVEKGEMVEFNRTKILSREHVNPTFYSAWATQYMQFDNTNVSEFAAYIEKRFEVEVLVSEPEVSGITLDGAAYFRSLEELIRSVSEVSGIPVYRSGKTVYIGYLRK